MKLSLLDYSDTEPVYTEIETNWLEWDKELKPDYFCPSYTPPQFTWHKPFKLVRENIFVPDSDEMMLGKEGFRFTSTVYVKGIE